MRLFIVIALGAASVVSPAMACRAGGSNVMRFKPPTVLPSVAGVATVKADVQGFKPGPSFSYTMAEAGRGYLVGKAKITAVLSGKAPKSTLPLYLEMVTSCSEFARGDAGAVAATGYLVGQVVTDRRGTYLRVIEEQNSAPPPPGADFPF